jgi:hypothetical protein
MSNIVSEMDFNCGNLVPFNNLWDTSKPGLIINSTTNKSFKIYGTLKDRLIFFAATLIGSPIQSVISFIFYIIHSLKAIFYTITLPCNQESSLKDRLINLSFTLLRMVFIQPIALVAFQIVCIFGLFFPNNAKKIYEQIEILAYGRAALSHLFITYTTTSVDPNDI